MPRSFDFQPLALVVLLLSVVASAYAQDLTADVTATDNGGSVGEVSMDKLNIHLDILAVDKAGVALPFSFGLHFDNNFWYPQVTSSGKQWQPNLGGWGISAFGWKDASTALFGGFVDDMVACNGVQKQTTVAWIDGAGQTHKFPHAQPNLSSGCSSPDYSVIATDGSGLTFQLNANFTNTYFYYDTVITPGGIILKTAYTNQGVVHPGASEVDTNGNKITRPVTYPTSFTDALGVSELTYPLSDKGYCRTPDGSGETQTTTYTYPTSKGNATVTVYCIQETISTGFGCNGISEYPATSAYLVDHIVMADGSKYSFAYEGEGPGSNQHITGRLASVTFPTGATHRYTYNYNSDGPYGISCNDGSVLGLTRVTPDGTWNFTRSYVGGGCVGTCTPNSSTTTVTGPSPSSNKTIYSFGGPNSTSPDFTFGGSFLVQKKSYQGSSTLLQTEVSCYNGNQSNCTSANIATPITEIDKYTTLAGMTTSKRTQTTFDKYGNVTKKAAYDFGATVPAQQFVGVSYGYSWNGTSCIYMNNGVNNAPCKAQWQDGSGNILKETRFTYDAKGNLTSTARLVTGSTYLTSSASYNGNGTLHTRTDPNGNVTTFNYDGSCNNLLSTSTTFPIVNEIALTTSQAWDCNGAAITSSTDANNNKTTYSYVSPSTGLADPWWRVTKAGYPDGGGTTATYLTGATIPWKVSNSTSITSSLNLNKTTIYDGLGRVSQAQLTSDPDGVDYVDTTYDSLGRKATVSNPHRAASSSTDGITTYGYDALDRVVSVLQPDKSRVSIVYTGNCKTETDEVGKARKSCVDGLGRLTGIWEDPSGLNYETDYTYDALNNLLSVTQKGSNSANARLRSFQYDGLSRLTQATNPESGTTTYSYAKTGGILCAGDPNAVCTKTAISPNQSPTGTFTVTTTYTYDALNRLTGESYQDSYSSNSSTPTVQFGYDGVALSGCTKTPSSLTDTYPKGHRTAMCDGSGATSWSHDTMGRVLSDDRLIGGASSKATTYTYNLDGSTSQVTTPDGRSVTYTTGGAARPLAASDGSGINYVKSVTYAPPGELKSMTMGWTTSFAGIVTTNAYNDRLQPILLSAGVSGQNPVFSLCYDFHLGVAVNTPPCSFSASTLGDNGNVNQIVNNRDNTRTENFTYDSLNRIASGYSSGTQWGETFTIDSWGNLTNRGGVTGKTYYEPLSTSAGANNRLSGFGYDAAGNMTSNGSTSYVYDGENRLFWTSGYRYLYDGDGQRVEKCVAATSTTACPSGGTNGTLYWRGTGSDTLDESDLSGNMLEQYAYFNGRRVARRDISTNAVHYYFSDHLSTHGVVENATGSACEQDIDYYPYGGQGHDSCPNVAQNYKFTGKERDRESGLDEFGARYYASSLGRFMVPDWAAKPTSVPYANFGNPQSLNLYSYVQNNPTTVGDPDGHGDAGAFCGQACREAAARYAADHPAGAVFEPIVEFGTVPTLAIGGGAAWGSVFLRNLLGLALATSPRTVPIVAGAIEGLTPGPSGSLTISTPTRLTEQEISTGVRLANQTGKGLAQSAHVGEEFVDAAGKTYDAMGGGKAFEYFGDGSKFFDSIVTHVNKSVDVVALDLKGASKDQIGAIKDFVKTLTKKQQEKITYVN